MPFDYIFTNAINGEHKHFVELLDVWLPPQWYVPGTTLTSVASASPDYSFVAYQSTVSYDGVTYRPLSAVRSSISETQSGEEISMTLSLDGIGYITPEPLMITELTEAQITANLSQFPDGTVIQDIDSNFFIRNGSSLDDYDTPKSINTMLKETEIRNARILLRRVPIPYRGSTYTTTPKTLFRGYISKYSFSASSVVFECSGMLHKWGNGMVPARLMGPGCQVPFGSSACNVVDEQGVASFAYVVSTSNLPAVKYSESIEFLDTYGYELQDTDAFDGFTDDNHFGAGYVIIVSVDYPYNDYVRRYTRIKSFDAASGILYLAAPLPVPVELLADPAAYNLSLVYRAACGKNKTECKRWKNLSNYKGADVPKVPTLTLGMELY